MPVLCPYVFIIPVVAIIFFKSKWHPYVKAPGKMHCFSTLTPQKPELIYFYTPCLYFQNTKQGFGFCLVFEKHICGKGIDLRASK